MVLCHVNDTHWEGISYLITKMRPVYSTAPADCSKLAQKEYKARHDLVGKVIHWEMYKKLKFDHTNKLYMHNPTSVLENDTHKLQWDFGIQTYL